MDKPLTSAGFNMIIVAAKIIRDHGEFLCSVRPDGEIQVGSKHFKTLAEVAGAEIRLRNRVADAYPWEAGFTVDGIHFMAVFRTADLPSIGYEIPGYVSPSTTTIPVRIAALQPLAPA